MQQVGTSSRSTLTAAIYLAVFCHPEQLPTLDGVAGRGWVQTIERMGANGHGPFSYSEETTSYGNPFHPGALNYCFSTGSSDQSYDRGHAA
jgi:hypothetical protein